MGTGLSLIFKNGYLVMRLTDTIFFYFRVRSACKAYRVPWGSDLKDHLILRWKESAPRQLPEIYAYIRSERLG